MKTDYFQIDHLSSEIKARSVRGGAITFAGQTVKAVLQILSTVMLARLLTPKDFGLVAMVTAVTGFILLFKDLGLSAATVQRAEINHSQVSNLFWVNLAASVFLMALTLAAAPLISRIYGEPRLTGITCGLAVGILFQGLPVQHLALLARQMSFSRLAAIDVCSLLAGIMTGILCAWFGMGYWALVLMQLSAGFVKAAVVWIVNGWRPGTPAKGSGVLPMLAFGGNMTGFNTANYFARNADNMLIGRWCGSEALGFYSRAYSLMLLPISQITAPVTAVAMPALSRLQNEPERFRSYYLKAITFIAYVTMPLIAALCVTSNEVIRLVLGRQWAPAAPIFSILAVASIFQPVASTAGWIYAALNDTRRMFFWACISTPLLVLSFLAGLPWGPIGVAVGYAVTENLLAWPCFAFALKKSPVSNKDVALCLYRPLAISIVTGAFMLLIKQQILRFGLVPAITGSMLAGTVFFLSFTWAWNPAWQDMSGIFNTAKQVIARS